MRGLLPDERTILEIMAGDGEDLVCSAEEQGLLRRLAGQGRVTETPARHPGDGRPAVRWSISRLGLLALRVALPAPAGVR